MACKNVQRRVLSAYGYEEAVIKKVSKMIPDKLNITFEEALKESAELRNFFSTRPNEKRDIEKLEGLMSHSSTHAAGVIISPSEVTDYIPCSYDFELGVIVSQWNKKSVESIGLVKFDILGLKQLTIFQKTLEDIYKNHGIKVTRKDLMNIDYEDKRIYEHLSTGNFKGYFQFDAPSAKSTVINVMPKNFDDIMACESICRPGVLEANLYVTNSKLYKESGAYPVPEYWDYVKDVLGQTYGAIVYQEQTMLLMNKLTGGLWSLGKADLMRKVKNLDDYKEDFINCCIKAKTPLDVAEAVWSRFDLGYTFNKSHACSYGKTTGQSVYLDMLYPVEYMANNMTLEITKSEPDLGGCIKECISRGIKIIPPDINKSSDSFLPLKDGILMSLSSINKVGDTAVSHIISNRPYSSFEDFISKVQKRIVKKNIVFMLIKAGAFDVFEKNRSALLERYMKSIKEKEIKVPFWCDEAQIRFELESFGMCIGKHPLDGYDNKSINDFKNGEEGSIVGIIREIRKIKDKNGNEMCFISMENKVCNFTAIMFSHTYTRFKNIVDKIGIAKVIGTIDGDNIKVKDIQVV